MYSGCSSFFLKGNLQCWSREPTRGLITVYFETMYVVQLLCFQNSLFRMCGVKKL